MPSSGSKNNINGHIFETFEGVAITRKTAQIQITRGGGGSIKECSLTYYNRNGVRVVEQVSAGYHAYDTCQGYGYFLETIPETGYIMEGSATRGGLVASNYVEISITAQPINYVINFIVDGTEDGT